MAFLLFNFYFIAFHSPLNTKVAGPLSITSVAVSGVFLVNETSRFPPGVLIRISYLPVALQVEAIAAAVTPVPQLSVSSSTQLIMKRLHKIHINTSRLVFRLTPDLPPLITHIDR